jgi:hypothetical protein
LRRRGWRWDETTDGERRERGRDYLRFLSTDLGGESQEVEPEERERKEIIKTKVWILLFYTGREL